MESLSQRIMQAKRCPKRISITVSNLSYERIHELAQKQGRSASNLASFLIETSLAMHAQK
jgi:hypothetical protein